jgi:hypothetical protein
LKRSVCASIAVSIPAIKLQPENDVVSTTAGALGKCVVPILQRKTKFSPASDDIRIIQNQLSTEVINVPTAIIPPAEKIPSCVGMSREALGRVFLKEACDRSQARVQAILGLPAFAESNSQGIPKPNSPLPKPNSPLHGIYIYIYI